MNGTSYWGRSENLTGSLSAADQVYWFGQLKKFGQAASDDGRSIAGFLRHAEAQAVIQVSRAVSPMPDNLEIYSDRPTCGYACRPYLPDLFTYLGVKHVTIEKG